MDTDLLSVELSQKQFEHISRMMYSLCGINLQIGKEELVKARLTKRLRLLGLRCFDDYLQLVQDDSSGDELSMMVDCLTTNKTSFFRESQHFDYLRSRILPNLVQSKDKIRIWSAGCSSGEEPYTLSLVLREQIPDVDRRDVRILATDISSGMLQKARDAVYEQEHVADVPQGLLKKHFTCASANGSLTYCVNDSVRNLIRFARLNLMEEWPMKGPFDAIFCRNVMIYFDKPTQQRLVRRFWELLEPGGHLFVGHSESLTTTSREFRYVQPAVYVKQVTRTVS